MTTLTTLRTPPLRTLTPKHLLALAGIAYVAAALLPRADEVSFVPSPAAPPSLREIHARFRSSLKPYVESPLIRLLYAWTRDFKGSFHTVHYFLMSRVPLFRRNVTYARELVRLRDGGTVALDFAELATRDGGDGTRRRRRKLVLIQHGLAGDAHSHYVVSLIDDIASREGGEEFDFAVFVARGCGNLELTPNVETNLCEGFTAARTQDFREAVELLSPRYDEIVAVGFSLGAGILLKYLGEEGERAVSPGSKLRAAVAISPSFDFSVTPKHFDTWSRLRLVKGLQAWSRRHETNLSSHPQVDWEGLMAAKNVREFDERAIVKAYGYRDVDHYYAESSAVRVSHEIRLPTLAMNALDDPVCHYPRLDPGSQMGPGLALLLSRSGGHVSFASGLWGQESYMNEVTWEWMEAVRKSGRGGD